MATKTYPEVNGFSQAVETGTIMEAGAESNTLQYSTNFFATKDNKTKSNNNKNRKNNSKSPKQNKKLVLLQPEDVMMNTKYREPEIEESDPVKISGDYSKFCFIRKATFKYLAVPNIKEFGWSPDGKYIVIPSEVQKNELVVLDIEASTTNKPVVLRRLSGFHKDRITAAAWSPNGNNIASGQHRKIT